MEETTLSTKKRNKKENKILTVKKKRKHDLDQERLNDQNFSIYFRISHYTIICPNQFTFLGQSNYMSCINTSNKKYGTP